MDAISIVAILVILLGLAVILWQKLQLVLGLIVLIILIYILQIASSSYFEPVYGSRVFFDMAFAPTDIVNPTYFYTVFTSMFLHANLLHLLFNLFALYFLGTMLETRIGRTRFLTIYVIAGLAGGLTWAAIHWGQLILAVGASGAIMGVLAAFARLYGRERIRMIMLFFPLPPLPAYVIFVMILVIDLIIALTNVTFIAAEDHLGGAIAGFLIAPLVMKIPTAQVRQERAVRIHRSTMESLATTPELREMLKKIEKETVPDVQKVWFQHFMQKARCPVCGGLLSIKGDSIYSDCGWRTRL
ncbi:MAG: rhomboid family intramembrane serine protease [Thermoplasmata archaeon]|nr:rhomboid family intramembrane serine protease [Thermoplasmata archaeon]